MQFKHISSILGKGLGLNNSHRLYCGNVLYMSMTVFTIYIYGKAIYAQQRKRHALVLLQVP